ncbi:Putative alternaria alternata allergen 1 [Septoria linicola]|uniref:Alternaria alternata allergen 1 n=1 Tax=Septoria linicola TaxID=215465 RepID=A0A9Q9AMU1_9PEZI|nr:putative alternaria alternata allergen 1 [Septoria linicola]USW51860.1 Putative alternaria alternata allergen 1 [Septoria linicola]
MKFSLAAVASTLMATALAAPTTSAADDGSTSYQIKDFTLRKLNGKDISTMSFRILATNGGTLDFECVPYDPVTNGATENFQGDHVYSCGENTFFSFNYIPKHDTQTNELYLWQNVSDTVTLGGSAFLDDPICRAGGAGVDDLVCKVPEQVHFVIPMRNLLA